MEEAPENSKESSHSAHAKGMNEYKRVILNTHYTSPVDYIKMAL